MTQNVLSGHFTLFAEVTPFEVNSFELVIGLVMFGGHLANVAVRQQPVLWLWHRDRGTST